MEQLKLNETPVRTSRNFNINNIKLENIEIPQKVANFENIEIICQNNKKQITRNIQSCDLVYGISDILTKQLNENANQKLKLNIDSKENEETQITFNFDSQNIQLIDHIEIEAQEQTKATIIIKYKSQEEIEAYHNGIIKLQAKNKADINVILINLMNQTSNNFISIENKLEEDAKVTYTIVDFGGKNSITNYYSNLKGISSNNKLNTIYLGSKNQTIDLNYIAELRGEKTNIDIEVQGALKDTARKHFKGTIDFKKGCKKAIGNENENCMLLSETAKSIALPMLLCSEEEVEGNHATSAGRVGDKELFYIMSRGFNPKEAMKLMVKAKFNKILENIENEEIKNEIEQEIDKRLD